MKKSRLLGDMCAICFGGSAKAALIDIEVKPMRLHLIAAVSAVLLMLLATTASPSDYPYTRGGGRSQVPGLIAIPRPFLADGPVEVIVRNILGRDVTIQFTDTTPICGNRSWTVVVPRRGSVTTVLCYSQQLSDVSFNYEIIDDKGYKLGGSLQAGYSISCRIAYCDHTPFPPSPGPNPPPKASCSITWSFGDNCGSTASRIYVQNYNNRRVRAIVKRDWRNGTQQGSNNLTVEVEATQKAPIGCERDDTYPYPTYNTYTLLSCN